MPASYLPLPDQAARQLIDSTAIFEELRRVQSQTRKYAGGMHWKRQDKYEYLIRTTPDNRGVPIGPRSPETEKVYEKFKREKEAAEDRARKLRVSFTEAERLNKAVRAGRAPNLVVDILRALEDRGLDKHFIVVGTHALYAYEAAAGVWIASSAMATKDVDLLWDARKRVEFITDMERAGESMLSILKKVDSTFVRSEEHKETAVNANGFQVDFLRRMQSEDDPHPFRLSANEEDLFVVQARRAQVLNEAPAFEHPIVSVTGRMVLMRTVDPEIFVRFKRWLANGAPDRDPQKRGRDLSQAEIVHVLLEEGRLQSKIRQAI